MEEFAFIHQNTPNGQILVTKEFDVDDEEHKVTVAFLHSDLKVEASIKHLGKDDAADIFENLKKEKVVLNFITKLIPN